MIDRREGILVRLFTVLQGVEGIIAAWRNRGELPDDKRPACVLLDGDETVSSQAPSGRGEPGLSAHPAMVVMRPEIFFLLEQREPKNVLSGEDLNAFRIKCLKAINDDTQLAGIVGTSGSILYEGCNSDFATGRGMTGQLQLRFAFAYPLKASEFAS
jgi:hypothetical protein